MMRLKGRHLAILSAAVLWGCFDDAKLRASTPEEFEKSYAEMAAKLDAASKAKLDDALRDIVLVESGLYQPILLAKTFHLPGVTKSDQTADQIAQAYLPVLLKATDGTVEKGWQEKKAEMIVKCCRVIVDGRSGAEILKLADGEKKKGLESALQIYQAQLTQAEAALEDAKREAEADSQKAGEDSKLIKLITITKPRFWYHDQEYVGPKPIISFNIKNDTGLPIKAISLHGKVQSPGRAVPWVEEDFSYDFAGGLENAESQSLDLAPNMFSDWGKIPKEVVASAILTIEVNSFDDPQGKKIGRDMNPFVKEKGVERLKSLQKAIESLLQKIDETKAEIGRQPS